MTSVRFLIYVCVSLELERDGFCQNPFFECLVAEVPEEHKSKDGKSITMALAVVFLSQY